jgi:hypothetical protein
MSAFREEENIIKMPASFGVDKSRRVRSDFVRKM